MTTKYVLSSKNLSDNARLAKNASIKASMKATQERRKKQTCRVFDFKIQSNKLSIKQKEALTRIFLEAKWLRNDCLAHGIDGYEIGATVEVKTPQGIEEREFQYLGSQMKQSVVQQLKNDRLGLARRKKNGGKIGRLKFVSEVNSVNLKQYGNTYRFLNDKRTRMKVQNVPNRLCVRGIKQIPKGAEFANAKLVQRADGYHVLVTTFLDNEHAYLKKQNEHEKGTVIGIDMGLKTSLTYSDRTKVNVRVGESDRLKRLQKKLARQTRGSNNYHKTLVKIRREYQKMTNLRNDHANKVVRDILRNEYVFIQDENISGWRRKNGCVRGSRTVQQNILGRVKARLKDNERVYVLPRHIATTQHCPECGFNTKHTPDLREFECSNCGYTADRDVNAACNMVRLGIDHFSPMEHRLAPVEKLSSATNDELARLSCKMVSMKQEAQRL